MWKIFFCGVAVALSTALGRASVGKYGRRYSFFSEMKRFNEFTAENGDLTEEEIRIANEYFGKVGKNSLQGEKNLLEEYSVYFGQKAAACAEEKKRYSSLGGKLGFLAGVAATIVIL